ncbi:hypothetical protein OEW28_11555 [Defluviimonas sp. WL0002]|uniref:Uncharacterized protein n=1 Tax=Albidovulum marisflavi TaxID=2984159 RepID=A0ABT2ZDP2_9RHOB|nr:hypothetical protein [Defluviimonas sp. WL0002]MCV2869263.1 hypothetical protein [Defluviimonas sp. WL0002]
MRPVPITLAAVVLAACAPGTGTAPTAARAPYPELLPLSELLSPEGAIDGAATAAALEAEAAALRARAAALKAADG